MCINKKFFVMILDKKQENIKISIDGTEVDQYLALQLDNTELTKEK